MLFLRYTALLAAVSMLASEARAFADDSRFRLGPFALFADQVSFLSVGAGAFDVAREQKALSAGTLAAGDLQLRFGRKLLYCGPLFGILANHRGGLFGYGGAYFDVGLGSANRWHFSPLLTAGGYRQGQSKFLGGRFAFQLGGNLSMELPSGSRVGLTVTHISNAFIYYQNPGAESVLLTYAVPLTWRVGLPR